MTRKVSVWGLAAALLVAPALVAAAALVATPALAQGPGAPAADPRMAEHALGDPKAPVRMDEYYSLDCSHCADFDVNQLPKLKADYIDKGKVYLVLHDFPLHELALRATMLARCLPSDRFIPFVDTLFHVQQGWLLQTMGAAMDALKQQAKFAGMSDSQIDACLADRNLENAIFKERLDAEQSLHIEATPTFIFNQTPADKLAQAGPYDVFQSKIDSLLKK
jgi:protein-disulfide isomerase